MNIQCTVAYSLPEIMKLLMSHEDASFVYTVKFNQDSAEAFFGGTAKSYRAVQQPSFCKGSFGKCTSIDGPEIVGSWWEQQNKQEA